jgi:histidinol phosphatase-like PHP family hydrolase
VEVKAVNLTGDVDFPELANDRLDFVIGVIHQFPLDPKKPLFGSSRDLAASRAWTLEVEASINMMESGAVDVLGHPTRTFTERYKQPFPYEGLKELVRCASRCGVAVELNARSGNLRELLELCLASDCRISIGSDAHEPHEIGAIVRVLEELLGAKGGPVKSVAGYSESTA